MTHLLGKRLLMPTSIPGTIPAPAPAPPPT